MKERIVPIIIVIALIIFGYILKRFRINVLIQKKNFVMKFHEDFINFSNDVLKNKKINHELYEKILRDIDSIQIELGSTGIISDYVDYLRNIKGRDLQLFPNYMNEVRMFLALPRNMIAAERLSQYVGACEDALLRHDGNLNKEIELIKKNLLNPFSCFADSIRWLVGLPIDILRWCGLINHDHGSQTKMSLVFKIISNIIVFIGLLGSLMTIVLGWDEFWKLSNRFFAK